MRLLLVCLGGAIGTGLRYVTAGVAARWLGADFPYGTLIVNLSGAFVVGLVQEIGTRTLLVSDTSRVFLSIGVLGGLTTYSTFSYETVRLAEVGAWYRAWLNVVVTTAGCLALCALGIVAARLLVGPRG
jgi:CrcB protein